MKEIVEGEFPLPPVNMKGMLEYWEAYRLHEWIDTYYELMGGFITVEKANARMGVEFYKLKESK